MTRGRNRADDSPGKKSLILSTPQSPGGRQQTRVVLSRGNRPASTSSKADFMPVWEGSSA